MEKHIFIDWEIETLGIDRIETLGIETLAIDRIDTLEIETAGIKILGREVKK